MGGVGGGAFVITLRLTQQLNQVFPVEEHQSEPEPYIAALPDAKLLSLSIQTESC